jgi:ubiquinone biosynthesis protein
VLEYAMNQKLFKLLFSGYINKRVGKIWINQPTSKQHSGKGSFDSVDIINILAKSWEIYLTEALSLPQQPRMRLTLIMNFACLTLSAYQTLVGFGIEKDYAIELIYELVWDVTSRSASSANRLTKSIYQDTMRRLEVLVDLVMRVVFCEPAYQTNKGELQDGFFMDVCTCPVADYMISNQASDLCVNTWCAVDFGLVDIIGGRLERSGTRAMGKEKCDFRFHVIS